MAPSKSPAAGCIPVNACHPVTLGVHCLALGVSLSCLELEYVSRYCIVRDHLAFTAILLCNNNNTNRLSTRTKIGLAQPRPVSRRGPRYIGASASYPTVTLGVAWQKATRLSSCPAAARIHYIHVQQRLVPGHMAARAGDRSAVIAGATCTSVLGQMAVL